MIGLFDSGSGGLTVLSAIRKHAPVADIVYFGDIANAPYGEKSAAELADLTERDFAQLEKMGATQIVSACNTVALSVLRRRAERFDVIEMTRPEAHALRSRAGARILLIATPAAIQSHMYADAIGVTVQLEELPAPGLAGAIEFGAPEAEVRHILHDLFLKKEGKHFDGLILGCTHYPLARNLIQEEAEKIFGPIEILDPADAVADEVLKRFDTSGNSKTRFAISKESDVFRKRVRELFPDSSYTIDVV